MVNNCCLFVDHLARVLGRDTRPDQRDLQHHKNRKPRKPQQNQTRRHRRNPNLRIPKTHIALPRLFRRPGLSIRGPQPHPQPPADPSAAAGRLRIRRAQASDGAAGALRVPADAKRRRVQRPRQPALPAVAHCGSGPLAQRVLFAVPPGCVWRPSAVWELGGATKPIRCEHRELCISHSAQHTGETCSELRQRAVSSKLSS